MIDFDPHDYCFHLLFRAEGLAKKDASSTNPRKTRTVVCDGAKIGTITPGGGGYSPVFDLNFKPSANEGARIGPSFDQDRLRQRVIRLAFAGDAKAFERAEIV